MTITSTVVSISYAGDGTSTGFAVPFVFYGPDELTVYTRTGSGSLTQLTRGIGYTVTGGNGSAGTVAATTAPASGTTWVIRRATARTQQADYTDYDPFPATTTETALDRLTAQSQETDESISRTIRGPFGDAAVAQLPAAAARAGLYLAFDANGAPVALAPYGTGPVSLAMTAVVGAATTDLALTYLQLIRPVHVKWYGAVGDGVTDDATAIRNAITAAIALGQDRVNFDDKIYAIGSLIALGNGSTATPSTVNGIRLVGGGGIPFVRLGIGNVSASGTQLKWTGAIGGTMVQVQGPAFGNYLENIALDCNSRASCGLSILSGSRAVIPHLTIANYTGTGLDITTQQIAILSGGSYDNSILGSEGLIFDGLQLCSVAAGCRAMRLNGYLGDGIHDGYDTTRCVFNDIYLIMPNNGSAVGIEFDYTDQCNIHNLITTRIGTSDATAPTIRYNRSTTSSGYAFPETIALTGNIDIGQNGFVQFPSGTPIGEGNFLDNLTSLDLQNTIRYPENQQLKFTGFEPGTFPTGGFWADGGLNRLERSFRNQLANATFARATRGTSFTVTSSGTYTLDSWKVTSDGTMLINVNRIAFSAGQTIVPYQPKYFIRLTVTSLSGATYLRLSQPIPNVALLAGRATILSAWAEVASGTAQLSGALIQNFGTGGSPSSTTTTGTGTLTASTVFTRLFFPLAAPSISGKTLGSNADDYTEIAFALPVTGAPYTIDIALPQWEAGIIDTAFELRPDSIDDVLCGRLLRTMGAGCTGGCINTTSMSLAANWQVPMRKTPTASMMTSAPAIMVPGDNTYTASGATVSVLGANAKGASVSIGGFTGLTAFRPTLGLSDVVYLSAEP